MLVKCKCCDKKIERDSAYKVIKGKVNTYYCSEEEYVSMTNNALKQKELTNSVKSLIDEIFGYKVINTIIYKEINEWKNIADLTVIIQYLGENMTEITNYMNKDFTSEYGKIRYFSAIVKNNICDYSSTKKEEIKREYISDEFSFDNKYKSREKKKTMTEYEDEVIQECQNS